MSDLRLATVCRELVERADTTLVPEQGFPRWVDDYFVERMKQDEMHFAELDSNLYEGLRELAKREVAPLFASYVAMRNKILERKQKRKLVYYILGTVGFFEVLELFLTRGKSLVPAVFIPSLLASSFIGLVIYLLTQRVDDLFLARVQKQLLRSVERLDERLATDTQFDHRRRLLDEDVLKADVVEIIASYPDPEEFWRHYRRARETDPTTPGELKQLRLPAFDKFLKHHASGEMSDFSRQSRFNRLFIEAHELYITKDRENYALRTLKAGRKEDR